MQNVHKLNFQRGGDLEPNPSKTRLSIHRIPRSTADCGDFCGDALSQWSAPERYSAAFNALGAFQPFKDAWFFFDPEECSWVEVLIEQGRGRAPVSRE
jgi:hypothetical protein